MAVLGGLVVDGVGEVEFLDDDTGPHVEVLANDLNQLVRGPFGGAVSFNEEGEGLRNTNSIGELDKSTASKAGSDQRLGDPAAKVSSRAVDLGVVLAREGTTTVCTPAAICVDDDLTASEASITLGSTNNEEAGGLNLSRISIRVYQNTCS